MPPPSHCYREVLDVIEEARMAVNPPKDWYATLQDALQQAAKAPGLNAQPALKVRAR